MRTFFVQPYRLAYVEFEHKDSIIASLALSGQLISGFPITVTSVLADKARIPPKYD